MSSNEIIERLIVEASTDPLNPVKNFEIALEYDNLKQTASAVSFYLRAAEYGIQTHPLLVYASLLRVSICMESQGDRNWSVSNNILQAMAYLPARPEAYFLMSRFHERSANWQESYTFAEVGLLFAQQQMDALPCYVSYIGPAALLFQKSVAAWYIGRRDESLQISLLLDSIPDLPDYYKEPVKNNLEHMKKQ